MKPKTKGELLKRGRSLQGWNAPDGLETFYEVRSRDSLLPPEEFAQLPRRPIRIVLDNLRSAFNVGAIFRLADAIRAEEVITCGYTCHPPHHKLEQTALGATESVPWRHFRETTAALTELRHAGVQVIGVETVVSAVLFHHFPWHFPAAIVLGNEALGLSPSVLKLCHAVIQIPVFGFKNSINVATACAVILYDLARQAGWLDQPQTAR